MYVYGRIDGYLNPEPYVFLHSMRECFLRIPVVADLTMSIK